ncbi:MAG: tyrosine-type recombinase/integrase, partial [Acholeplasma sp.]|nr:tyrosine-type recombinase/integrase [Acholeplasma sp.]
KMFETERLALKRAKLFFLSIGKKKITKIKRRDVELWIDHMKIEQDGHKALSNKSINEYIGVFKRFIKFNKIYNDIQDIPKLKVKQKYRESLSHQTLHKIYDYFDSIDLLNENNLLRASMFYTLLFTGGRSTETVELMKKDVDLENKFIIFRKIKGNKERAVPISDTAAKYLKLMMDSHPYNYVFHNKLKERKAVYNDARYLAKFLRNTLKTPYFSCHMLRHTFATTLVNNGADLSIVQDILGHEDERTTRIYAKMNFKRIKQTYDDSIDFD